ncbi:MAG: Rrf2 family transcriptional regulator [Clostridia bacterium]|nr:Rrf2 family transcriptional regulator [Clostridia bacterium]
MRITQEADYAIRIVCLLAERDEMLDANTIAEKCCITQRFALKILRKLVLGNLVCSFKGANGGYRLGGSPDKITMKNIIELIDGDIAISRCLAEDHVCSRSGENKSACFVHCVFDVINRDVVRKLEKVTVADLIDPNVSVEDIVKNF